MTISRRCVGSARYLMIGAMCSILMVMTEKPVTAAEQSNTSPEAAAGLQAASWLTTIPYGAVKVAYALGGGIVGGLTWAMSGGDLAAAKEVWVPSMTGDYIVQPQNLSGEKPLHFIGRSSENAQQELSAQTLH
ncbi:hypothetical protein W02_01790 [Nitrospira sp. KM1]|uniref:hypothetical protein n=1 Tax=Nitrospira sp. KM1 TaxID=1936990 RepID=UPI0013A74F99|nr:hypothetical protein [Nitrospira sp. KM1]BCA53039.1 hypothetical protein W02_01790 [Nitrospira sp. KM1]